MRDEDLWISIPRALFNKLRELQPILSEVDMKALDQLAATERAALLSPSLKTAREGGASDPSTFHAIEREENLKVCMCCGVELGGQHRPSCGRQGQVTTDSLDPEPAWARRAAVRATPAEVEATRDAVGRDPSAAERAAVAELARAAAIDARPVGWVDYAPTPADVEAAKPPYFGGSAAFRLWLVRMDEISVRSFELVRVTDEYIIFRPYALVEAIWCRRCLTASTRPNDVVRRYCIICSVLP